MLPVGAIEHKAGGRNWTSASAPAAAAALVAEARSKTSAQNRKAADVDRAETERLMQAPRAAGPAQAAEGRADVRRRRGRLLRRHEAARKERAAPPPSGEERDRIRNAARRIRPEKAQRAARACDADGRMRCGGLQRRIGSIAELPPDRSNVRQWRPPSLLCGCALLRAGRRRGSRRCGATHRKATLTAKQSAQGKARRKSMATVSWLTHPAQTAPPCSAHHAPEAA